MNKNAIFNLNLTLPSEAQWNMPAGPGPKQRSTPANWRFWASATPRRSTRSPGMGNSGVEFDLENGHDSSGWEEKQYPHTRVGRAR